MKTIISAFLLVFLAEMGDKTQFLSLIFATKYKIYQVILGVFLGVVANHGIAVILAKFLSSFVNMDILKIIAGIMFLIFGLESFIFKIEEDEDANLKYKFGAVLTVATCFFIAELGDKTQITAMSVVFTGKNPFLTLIGTTLGMLFVSLFGIAIGKLIKGRIPKNMIKKISGICFIIFGIDALRKSVPVKYLTAMNIIIFYLIIMSLIFFIYIRNLRLKKSMEDISKEN